MDEPPPLQRLIVELSRRRVLRVAGLYAVVAWVIIQIAETAFPYLALPTWTITLVIALLVLGFPVALVLGWAYDITPAGVRRTAPSAEGPSAPRVAIPRRGLAIVIMGAVVVLGGYIYAVKSGDDVPPGAAADAFRSIAVLPFVNMSADPENEYFSDGLTEELLNVLAQVEGLRVAARTSAFAFKGTTETVTEIGRRLTVEKVLEGSVRKTGDRLRVTAQLINVADGYHDWSATFDHRQTADVFAIQDSIAYAIVSRLLPSTGNGRVDSHSGTTNIHAYEDFLKGRYAFWQGASELNLRTAIRHYEAAIQADPDYALAYAGLSDAYMLLGGQHAAPHDAFPQARAAALRALELDEQLAEGYVALASINWFYDWDWQAAERNYRRSFSVNRTVYTRCICYSWYLALLGDVEAAVREAERVRAFDPIGHLPVTTAAQMYYLAGRYDDARAMLRVLEESGSTSALIPRLRAWLAWDEGRQGEAVEIMERYRSSVDARGGFTASAPPIAIAELAYMRGRTGRLRPAAELAAALQERAATHYVPAEFIAVALTAAGDTGAAAKWIEGAYRQRSNLGMFSVYPIARALRDTPAYHDVLRRIGVPRASRTASFEE
jgi:adenylate cyclase